MEGTTFIHKPKTKMKIVRILVIICIVGLAACKQTPVEPPEKKECSMKGKFETAMCGWGIYDSYWIRLEDGTFLQPCKSDIPLIDKDKIYNGREVEVGYRDISYTEKGQCNSNIACLAYPGEHINVSLTCLKLLGEDKPKEEDPKCEYKSEGVLYNWTGKLDGCGWIIKHNNGETLEVLDDDIKGTGLTDGTTVVFDYSYARRMSVCMAGLPVVISCIKAKPENSKCKYENQGILSNNGTCWMIEGNDGAKYEVIDSDNEIKGIDSGTPVLFSYSAMRMKGNCMPSIPAKIWCIKVANTTF